MPSRNGRYAAPRRLCAALLAVAMVAPAARAAEPRTAAEFEAKRVESVAEYERVAREISLSEERIASLTGEIATVKKDHASLTAALIQAAKTERKLAEDIEDITSRLEELKEQEAAIRASLAARRDVLAEVLGALQRMGLNPPPALLVTPDDALSSVRSAILLGAVVPELRGETEILIADLAELARVVASIETERDKLQQTVREQAAEQTRLALLIEEKKTFQAASEEAAKAERSKVESLGAKAKSLNGLIASLEAEVSTRRSAEEKARQEEERRLQREAALAAMPLPDANRLAGPTAFAALRGQLEIPVAGRFARRFGGDDGNGAVMHGDMVATQSGAIVTAPADGNVLYAGAFRSYGQLLILDAGDGYHVVLAGMGRISVAPGQSVIAGEPVGAMGEARVASASASETETRTPELYVEFRKDGAPVDPAPWWSARLSGRTGNDS
ncbi:MAG: murein hydrolase activator EnvC [Rhizobiaceae bacterium]|nr:murein hydrolase activator EnvC [Rhizobiaceae bacterium]